MESRNTTVQSAWAVLLLIGFSVGFNDARAQRPGGLPGNYPSKPIKVLVGVTAGAASDFLARTIMGKLSEDWGVPIVVENVPSGIGGVRALITLSKAPADGYTMAVTSGSTFQNAAFTNKTPFDVRTAFQPIAQLTLTPQLMATHPSLPFRTLKELIAYAKKNPGKLSYGSSGIGTSAHLAAELVSHMAGIKMTHIPYKGSTQSALDAAAGRIEVVFASTTSLAHYVKAGRLRAVGITLARRSRLYPELPTLAEQGLPGYEYSSWAGLVALAGLPQPTVMALNQAVNRLIASPELSKLLAAEGADVVQGSPEDFRKTIVSALGRVERLIQTAGLNLSEKP